YVALLLLDSSRYGCCSNNAPTVERDHEFFVGRNDPNRNTARFGADARPAGVVGLDVRQAVKAVAPHASVRDRRWQRKCVRQLFLGAMEGSIEACHLRQFRSPLVDQTNRQQIMWLVEWSERY